MIEYIFLIMDNAYSVFLKCYIYILFNVGKRVLRYKNVVHVYIYFSKEKSLTMPLLICFAIFMVISELH